MKYLSIFLQLNCFLTVYFNFYYFPFRDAIKFPIFVYRRFKIKNMGKLLPPKCIRTGMIRIGVYGLGIQDSYYSRTKWDVQGTIVFKGQASIGRGTSICVSKEGVIELGDNFMVTGRCDFVCSHSIKFGDNCLLSWDILLMDTDFHIIHNSDGIQTNSPMPIIIGANVWIGCRSTILKGVLIPDGCVISAGSTMLHHVYNESNCIYGGYGKRVEKVRSGIRWYR